MDEMARFVIPDKRSLPRTPIRGDPCFMNLRGSCVAWIAGQARNDKPRDGDPEGNCRISQKAFNGL